MYGMTQEREAKILEGAIDKYGKAAQTDMAIEEMAELTKALLKYRRYPSPLALESILEEMADVSIMLNQLQLMYGDPVDWEIAKLERLEDNLWKTHG